jgi:3'(2'), 5'-bisphosphate nucleotidase
MSSGYSQILNEVTSLCKKAMDEVYPIYLDVGRQKVERKEDGSPVTNADLLSHDIISRGLQKIAPEIPVISEEGILPTYEERKNMPVLWMVDPIDGTYGFINRTGDFTVNIALIKDQMPVLGVVGVPVTGETYFAVAGEGAFKIKDGHKSKLEARLFTKGDEALKFICSPNQKKEELANYFSKFRNPQISYRSGTIKFLKVASGEADIYPSNRKIKEWDTAAGQIIVEEAGGLVLRADNDQPMKYNKTDLRNPPFIAYGDIQDFQ